MVNLEKSKNAATVIAANTLRAHQDIAVLRFANVAHRLFVNGVQMRYEHDGSLSVDENEIVLVDSYSFSNLSKYSSKRRFHSLIRLFFLEPTVT